MTRIISKIKNGENKEIILLWFISIVLWMLSFLYPNQKYISPFTTCLWRGTMMIFMNGILAHIKRIRINFIEDYEYAISLIKIIFMITRAISFSLLQFYFSLPIIYIVHSLAQIMTEMMNSFIDEMFINHRQRIGLIIAFFGVIITCLNSEMLDSKFSYQQNHVSKFIVLFIYFLVSILFGIIEKRYKVGHVCSMNFHYGIGFIFICSFLSFLPFFSWTTNLSEITTLDYYIGIFFFGGLIGGSEILKNRCKQLGEESEWIFLQYFTIPLAFMMSFIRYEESLKLWQILGAIMVIIGGFKMLK